MNIADLEPFSDVFLNNTLRGLSNLPLRFRDAA